MKIVRTNNGSEFFNAPMAKLFYELGILHQSSCVCTPQQNGKVEHKHKHCHLLDVARALRFQTAVPFRYWGCCVLTTCYFINITPSVVLSGKSPYEIMVQLRIGLTYVCSVVFVMLQMLV